MVFLVFPGLQVNHAYLMKQPQRSSNQEVNQVDDSVDASRLRKNRWSCLLLFNRMSKPKHVLLINFQNHQPEFNLLNQ